MNTHTCNKVSECTDHFILRMMSISLNMLVSVYLLAGCQEDPVGDQGPIEVEVQFKAMVGDDIFQCGVTYSDQGATQSAVAFTDLRFYVYDVSLIDRDGESVRLELTQDGIWQHDMITLLDFEDGCENGNSALNGTVRGQVPAGQYRGLTFSVGVPPELNSNETMLEGRGSPLNLNAMFWSWRSGYKYLRLDTDLPFFRVHLGASACDDEFSCEEPNIATFTFDRFDHESDQVSLDIQTLLSDSDLTQNTEDTAPGCMGQGDDPDCQKIYPYFNLGEGDTSAFSITPK